MIARFLELAYFLLIIRWAKYFFISFIREFWNKHAEKRGVRWNFTDTKNL